MYESASLDFKTEPDQNENNELLSLEAVGISVDSLDNSCFEEKCAEILNRCRKADKSKYRFAFEQLDESTTESLINYLHNDIENDLQKRPNLSDEQRRQTFERYLQRIKQNEVQLNKLFNDLNRRLQNDSLACDKSTDKLSRSEYSTNSTADDPANFPSGYRKSNNHESSPNSESASKLTRSLQNDLIGALRSSATRLTSNLSNNLSSNFSSNLSRQLSNSKDYVPLFNLNNSFNSDSSSVSAPRSLIKQFLQNKTNSPTTSSTGQLSASLESSPGDTSKAVEAQTDQANRKNSFDRNSSETTANAGNLYTAFRNATENGTDRPAGGANLRTYNRKTSPIREEDEHESTKEVKKYTSFQNVTAMYRQSARESKARRVGENVSEDYGQNYCENYSQTVPSDERRLDCPRSISMNEIPKRRNLIKQYSLKSTNSNGQFSGEPNGAYPSSSPSNYLNGSNLNGRPSTSRTNRNSKECSISSGYLSSGGSNNTFDNKKHFQRMNFAQHTSAQVLPVCEDKQVQTSIYENQSQKNLDQQPFGHQCNLPPQPILINELPPNACCTNNSPVYVYYPNYSLPDLNFVQSSFQNVHLSPTKYQAPSLESSCSTVTNFKRRGSAGQQVNVRATSTNNKTRPKSCGDFEKLTKESFKHIQDWKSLKTLLPDDIKDLIKTLNLSDDEETDEVGRTKSKTTSNTPITNKTFQMAIIGNYLSGANASSVSTTSNPSSASYKNRQYEPTIRMRPKVLSRGSSMDRTANYQTNYSSNDCSSSSNTKRYSLQEPIHSDDCKLACAHPEACVQRRGMIKSATMNMPIIVQQQQRQAHANRLFCQAPCHSCCGINQMNLLQQQQMMAQQMSSCCSSSHCSASGNPFNGPCHPCHFAGIPSYSNYGNPHYGITDPYHQAYGQYKVMSPMKPCNPITEQNEDTDFDSLNCLMANGTASGELDFDKLLNCKGASNSGRQRQPENTNRNTSKARSAGEPKRNKSKLADCPREFRNSKENFNDLKNHWEKVAKKQSTPTATQRSAGNVRKDGQSKVAPHSSTFHSSAPRSSTQQAGKRPASNRYPRSQAKSKVDSRRSRSKSPEKSNKEVIILTKKAKPPVPARQANSSGTLTRVKAPAVDRASQASNPANKPTAVKKPVRPSSFNAQFKSMIPVPKSSNRSPPLK